MQDKILRPGADADLRAPDPKAGTYVIAGMAAPMVPPCLFVHGVRGPGNGPDLAVVGMAAELEINPCCFSLFQMVWLMIQQDRETLQRVGKSLKGLPVRVGAVVAADDRQALEGTNGIP